MTRIFTGEFSERPSPPPRWFDDGQSYIAMEPAADGHGRDLVKYDTATGKNREVLITAAQLTPEGAPAEALVHLEEVRRMSGDGPATLMQMAVADDMLGRDAEAERALHLLMTQATELPDSHALLASLLVKRGALSEDAGTQWCGRNRGEFFDDVMARNQATNAQTGQSQPFGKAVGSYSAFGIGMRRERVTFREMAVGAVM